MYSSTALETAGTAVSNESLTLAIMICTGKYLQIYVRGFEKRNNFAQIGDFGLMSFMLHFILLH